MFANHYNTLIPDRHPVFAQNQLTLGIQAVAQHATIIGTKFDSTHNSSHSILPDMVRLRKKSRANSSTAQPTVPRLTVSSISKPVRNFSRPFNSPNNKEYYCSGAGETNQPHFTNDQRDFGTNDRGAKTSLDRDSAGLNRKDEPSPAHGRIDTTKSHTLQQEVPALVQHSGLSDKTCDSELKVPAFPGSQDLLTGQISSSASSLSVPMKGVGVLPSAASARLRISRQVPTPDIAGLCRSPECPIEHAHFQGVYLFRDYPMISRGPFGASNPPPAIWAAYHRLQENQEMPEDFALYWGFKRQHTADSWKSLFREI